MNSRIVEDAIELHTDAGVKLVGIPGESNIARVGGMILQLMEAAGYESIKPQHGAVFAFAPRVHDDEVTATPFDGTGAPFPVRLTMIPGTRVTTIGGNPGGYFGYVHDYATGIEYEATFRERGYRLRPAGGE